MPVPPASTSNVRPARCHIGRGVHSTVSPGCFEAGCPSTLAWRVHLFQINSAKFPDQIISIPISTQTHFIHQLGLRSYKTSSFPVPELEPLSAWVSVTAAFVA